MKSFGKGRKPYRYKKCLIVDGYNIIPRLQQKSLGKIDDLENARNELANLLGEYSAFAGEDVILVFDAHRTDDPGAHFRQAGVDIYFTVKNETADERIERLVYEFRDIYPEVTVATSDYAEQQVTFGSGALRISADELIERLKQAGQSIQRAVAAKSDRKGQRVSDTIRHDIANILEKWRREK